MALRNSKWKFPLGGFTLVELVVVITILAILATIWFISTGWYSSRARDSGRLEDVASISKSLDVSIITAWNYPAPDNAFSVTYSGWTVWNQGIVGNSVINFFRSSISWGGINKKPMDPLKNTEYTYSSLAEGKAYQIKADYEGDLVSMMDRGLFTNTAYAAPGNPSIAYIRGNYGGLAAKTTTWGTVYVIAVPSIITSSWALAWSSISINTLSGMLLLNGKPLKNPNSFDPSKIAYSGSSLPGTNSEILNMMNALQLAYSGSDLANTSTVSSLLASGSGSVALSIGTSIVTWQFGGTLNAGWLVSGACTGLPSLAKYFWWAASYAISNAPNGTPLVASYSATIASSNTCQFNCVSGYGWNSSACVVLPSAPLASAASGVGATSITWNWQASAWATSYQFSTNNSTWVDKGNVLTFTETWLSASTAYSRYVKACTSIGCSSATTLSSTSCVSNVGSVCGSTPSSCSWFWWGAASTCSPVDNSTWYNSSCTYCGTSSDPSYPCDGVGCSAGGTQYIQCGGSCS